MLDQIYRPVILVGSVIYSTTSSCYGSVRPAFELSPMRSLGYSLIIQKADLNGSVKADALQVTDSTFIIGQAPVLLCDAMSSCCTACITN